MSLAIACSGDDDDNNDNNTPVAPQMDETPSETMAANEVHVFEKEYEITGEDDAAIMSPTAGEVTFEVHNDGEISHDFVIIKTDLGETALPVDGTKVDENGTGVDVVDKIDTIDAGDAETLSVDLDPGKYVVICNIAGHYTQGMHASFEVM